MGFITCLFKDRCKYKGKSNMCMTCKKNTSRNKEEDLYEEANDTPIPDKCPKLTYVGPAEQTSGYRCPVCNGYTNPYHVDREEPRCAGCGYLLNI